jgi:hypothetical protein
MNSITFYVWIEDFHGNMYQIDKSDEYEYAQHCGMEAMNESREVRAWHITATPGRPKVDRSKDPVPSSLERWEEFHTMS